MSDETPENKALRGKRWGEYTEEQKHLLELVPDIFAALNRVLNVIEKTRPREAREIERFKDATLSRLSFYDPFEGDDEATAEEIAARKEFAKRAGFPPL
jgi:hypothetical protein